MNERFVKVLNVIITLKKNYNKLWIVFITYEGANDEL